MLKPEKDSTLIGSPGRRESGSSGRARLDHGDQLGASALGINDRRRVFRPRRYVDDGGAKVGRAAVAQLKRMRVPARALATSGSGTKSGPYAGSQGNSDTTGEPARHPFADVEEGVLDQPRLRRDGHSPGRAGSSREQALARCCSTIAAAASISGCCAARSPKRWDARRPGAARTGAIRPTWAKAWSCRRDARRDVPRHQLRSGDRDLPRPATSCGLNLAALGANDVLLLPPLAGQQVAVTRLEFGETCGGARDFGFGLRGVDDEQLQQFFSTWKCRARRRARPSSCRLGDLGGATSVVSPSTYPR